MTAVLEAPATVSPGTGVRRPWLGLSAVLGATLMNLLDSTVVSVGGPAIQAEPREKVTPATGGGSQGASVPVLGARYAR